MTETHNDVGIGIDTEDMGAIDTVLGLAFMLAFLVVGSALTIALIVLPFAWIFGAVSLSNHVLGWAAPGVVVGLAGVLIWVMGVDMIASYK